MPYCCPVAPVPSRAGDLGRKTAVTDSATSIACPFACVQPATGRRGFVSNPCKAVIEGDASLARQINGVMTFANTAGSG